MKTVKDTFSKVFSNKNTYIMMLVICVFKLIFCYRKGDYSSLLESCLKTNLLYIVILLGQVRFCGQSKESYNE